MQPPISAKYHSCLIQYAKLAKPNEAIWRKWPKTSIGDKKPYILETDFFFKNRASSLFCLTKGLLDAKNQTNPMISC